jgi:Ca2+-binding EF-hand superfamily protein
MLAARFAHAEPAALSFDAMDFDHDGVLYVDEVIAYFALQAGGAVPASLNGLDGRPNAEQLFSRWDPNCDGKITRAEFARRVQ